MKVTFRNDRTDTSGKHNDRNFDVSKATHIDAERSTLNKYYTYKGDYYDGEKLLEEDSVKMLRDIELEFYEQNFMEHLNSKNQRNIDARHKGRNKNIEQYYRSYTSRPEGMIFEIGNYFDHASPEELWACAMEYAQRFNEAYGDNCRILDMALHMDEGSPHVHIRRVWIGTDDYGHKCVGQNKALEEMGFEAPDKDKEIGKSNNAKMTFTRLDRQMIIDICKDRGLDIEVKDASSKNEKHMSFEMYREKHPLYEKLEEMRKTIESYEFTLSKQDEAFEQARIFFLQLLERDEEYRKKLEEAKEMERIEKNRLINEVYEKAIKPAFENTSENASLQVVFGTIQKDITIRQHQKFLEEHGLLKEFEEYRKQKDEKTKAKENENVIVK